MSAFLRRFVVVIIAAVVAILGLTAPAQADPITYPTAGDVTDSIGDPVAGATAQLMQLTGDPGNFTDAQDVGSAQDAGSGTYSLPDVVADTYYTVHFAADGYHDSYLGGWDDPLVASYFQVTVDGSNVSHLTVYADDGGTEQDSLPTAVLAAIGNASVSGTVSDANGPLDGVFVTAYQLVDDGGGGGHFWTDAGEATTDGGGLYTIGGLFAGTYTLQFDVSGTDTPAFSQYLGGTVGQPDPEAPTAGNSFSLTADQDLTGKNVTLLSGQVISGTVKDGSTNALLSDVRVRLYSFDGQGGLDVLGDSFTDSSGAYATQTVPAGTYTLQFTRGGYNNQYLGGGGTAPTTPTANNSVTITNSNVIVPVVALAQYVSPDWGDHGGQKLAYCLNNVLPANDDNSTGEITLPFSLTFYGQPYSSLYVNNNGNVTFGAATGQFTPSSLEGQVSQPMIAPFFADVDTQGDASQQVTYGSSPDGKTFCVNWVDVGYFSSHSDKLNSFQLLLTTQASAPGRTAGDFDITFGYDQVKWETGDASDGVNGLGGTSAAAGYTAGTGDDGTFFQLPGSFVNGALLDGGPNSLIANKLNSAVNGRYIFQIRNADVQVQLGSLTGVVKKASDQSLVADASVQACKSTRCFYTTTDAQGDYNFPGIPIGTYTVTVYPPDGSTLNSGYGGGAVTAGTTTVVDPILLTAPEPLPSGTTINGIDSGVPTVYWEDPLVLQTNCPTGSSPTYKLTFADGSTPKTGPMAESPAGSGHFTATIPAVYPSHGDGQVNIYCTGGGNPTLTFDVYIDPSGTVVDRYGAPVAGATVTLQRADTADGPFASIAGGSALMSPGNRTNPDTTNGDGAFGWDVVPGFYQVLAHSATDGDGQSDVLEVPPAHLDIVIALSGGTAPNPTTAPVVTGTATPGGTLSVSSGSWPNGVGVIGHQWRVDGVPVAGATGSSYVVKSADAGKAVSVQLTVGKSGFDSFTRNVEGPTVTAPKAVLSAPSSPFTLASRTTLKWTGTDVGSTIDHYQVRYRQAAATGNFPTTWTTPAAWTNLTAAKVTATLSAGYDYCYEVRAVDAAQNLSPWSAQRCVARPLDDAGLTATSGWKRGKGSAYYLGTYTSTTTKGESLTKKVSLDRIGLVVTECATCGSVGVYVGTKLIGKVNLFSKTTKNKVLVTLPTFKLRTGTVKIKVLSTGKKVLIDGVALSRT
jgi:hypothetical protein